MSVCQQIQAQSDRPITEPDTVLIERIYIPRPDNYQPGDMLIQKDIFLSYQDMKIGYRKMIQERKATGKSIDSLYRANQQLLTSIEQQKRAMNREIEDMRQKVLHMSDLILEQDLDNIRFTERLESNYDKVKKAEQKKNSGAFTYGRMDKPTRRAVYIGGGITIIGVAAAFIFGN